MLMELAHLVNPLHWEVNGIANCILMHGFSQSTVEPHFERHELCSEAIFGNFW